MKKYLVIIILVILLVMNFSRNILNTNSSNTNPIFECFQRDSEYLVFSEIFQDKTEKDEKMYGLAIVSNEQNEIENNIWDLIEESDDKQSATKVNDYSSQFGLQGHIFSFMYNKMKIPFWFMKLMCCTILAIVIVAICYCIKLKYGNLMAGIFYITFLLSPWVVAFARNLYWVEFTWYLPILFGLGISVNYKKRNILLPFVFLSVFIKCLCGYEYISTIMLGTISFFVIDLLTAKENSERIKIVKTLLFVGLTCLFAFGVALIIHGAVRGEGNAIEGIKNIYKNDVLRRTIITTDKDLYTGAYRESMDATVVETVKKYFTWDSDVILGIEGRYFNAMCIFSLGILIFNAIRREKMWARDLAMFSTFLVSTLSWFVLAKSHSYIHTHINFVLWYFGFLQICIYIIIKFICKEIYITGKKIESGEEKI